MRWKYVVLRLRYISADFKQEQVTSQTTTTYKYYNSLILVFFLVTSCLSSYRKVYRVLPTALNVVYSKVAYPIFLSNSNRISCYFLFLFFPHIHRIFSLHLKLDDVVRWEQSLVPMLYNEDPAGEHMVVNYGNL